MKEIITERMIQASPEAVWAALVDFPRHADWNPFFASIEGEARVGSRLKVTARKPDGSGGISFKPTVTSVEPASLLRWEGKLFVGGLFDGTHYFRLEPSGAGTRLIHGEQFRGILIPLMGKTLRETEAGFARFNDALAAEVDG